MTNLEAIDRRISRRSYAGPVPAEKQTLLQQQIKRVNAKSGLAIRFVAEGGTLFGGFAASYGMFSGVRSFFMLVGNQADPHLKEKAGYYGQQLVLEATKLGLGTCWVGGTFNRKTLTRALQPGQQLVAVIVVGLVKQVQTVKEKLVYNVAHRSSKTPQQMMETDLTPPSWFVNGVTAASKAPSAINRQPVCFSWQKGVARAEIAAETDSEWIDLGIAKLHFELAAGGTFALGNSAIFTPVGGDI
ncbi:nitroreductase family protein [Ruminococcaceae bacterium OttesenSCG-928-A16]|nr:nitroreductase family protein [Ruminococcaceae bacterium OttesenSCG-928-A16]